MHDVVPCNGTSPGDICSGSDHTDLIYDDRLSMKQMKLQIICCGLVSGVWGEQQEKDEHQCHCSVLRSPCTFADNAACEVFHRYNRLAVGHVSCLHSGFCRLTVKSIRLCHRYRHHHCHHHHHDHGHDRELFRASWRLYLAREN